MASIQPTQHDNDGMLKNEGSVTEYKEDVTASDNFVYDDAEEEPALHWRTYLALFALVMCNYVAVLSLQAPPAMLNFIGASLNATSSQQWIVNAPNLVCAAIGPILSSASDIFQARKLILLGGCGLGVIGCAIIPGSKNIYRVIAGQTIMGFGYATTPLLYAIPSEILPRKWRPIAQAIVNCAAAAASISGPLAIGALVQRDTVNGWRRFFWIEMAMWLVSLLALLFGYNPPKRKTQHDSLSLYQKLGKLDILGCLLITVATTLLLVGMGLGGSLYNWTNARVLATIVVGGVLGVAFGLYQWRGTSTGILHHDLFMPGRDNGRTFALCTALFGVEAIIFASFIIFYPILTQALYESDAFLIVARSMPYWVATAIAGPIWGYLGTHYRTIRWPMFCGFIIWTGGAIGFSTLQPEDNFSALAFAAVSGIGFGAPMVMIITGVQLSVPHRLIATATSVATSSRALFNAVFTSIYFAIFSSRIQSAIPSKVPPAVVAAGLPVSSVAAFLQALTSNDAVALQAVPGVSPAIIGTGVAALKQAYADSLRIVFIITSAIAAVATASVLFVSDMRERMTYLTDAPVEELHAKGIHRPEGEQVRHS